MVEQNCLYMLVIVELVQMSVWHLNNKVKFIKCLDFGYSYIIFVFLASR